MNMIYKCILAPRDNAKTIRQAEYFIQELKKHKTLIVFNTPDLKKFIAEIEKKEREFVCDAIKAQMSFEVFVDEKFTPEQFEKAVDKIRNKSLHSQKRGAKFKYVLIDEKEPK